MNKNELQMISLYVSVKGTVYEKLLLEEVKRQAAELERSQQAANRIRNFAATIDLLNGAKALDISKVVAELYAIYKELHREA